MAHFTKSFFQKKVAPLGLGIFVINILLIFFSSICYYVLIFVPFFNLMIYFIIIELSVKMYTNNKLINYKGLYIAGEEPAKWHKKMGYLQILEILLPRYYWKRMYKRCGAKIGLNVVIAGKISEPDITEIEDNVVIGSDCIITGHEIYLKDNIQYIRILPVRIGKNCIIGAKSLVLPGVILKENTMISAGSIVKKEK